MKPIYELWDTEDSNLIGTFDSEDEALHVVRSAVEEHGAEAFAMVALGRDDGSGRTMPVAKGKDLADLALLDVKNGTRSSNLANVQR